jgi:hypothetical protein
MLLEMLEKIKDYSPNLVPKKEKEKKLLNQLQLTIMKQMVLNQLVLNKLVQMLIQLLLIMQLSLHKI